MKVLAPVINSMSDDMVDIYEYLFVNKNDYQHTKRYKLWELTKAGQITSDTEALKLLYDGNSNSKSALSHLKDELHMDLGLIFIAEQILNPVSRKMAIKYNDFDMMYLNMYEIAIRRKRQLPSAHQLATENLKKAQKSENHEAALISLKELLLMDGGFLRDKNINSLTDEVINTSNELTALKDTIRKRRNYQIKAGSLNIFDEYTRKELNELASLAEERFEALKSKRLENELYDIKSIKAEFDHDKVNVNNWLVLRYNLQKKNSPAVFDPFSLAMSTIDLGYSYLINQQYEKIDDLFTYFSSLEMSAQPIFLRMCEIYAHSLIFRSDYAAALKVIGLIIAHPSAKNSYRDFEAFLYYRAVAEFGLKQYDDALKTLDKTSNLHKALTGLWLGIRILEIMVLIEKKEEDYVIYRVESLKQLLHRNKKEELQRYKAIVELLQALVRSGYDYKKVKENNIAKFTGLEGKEQPLAWDPSGLEIMQFDKWFNERLTKKR
jgi:hypothetical protein